MTIHDTSEVAYTSNHGADVSTFRHFPPLLQGPHKGGPSRRETLSLDLSRHVKSHCNEFGSPYLLPVAWGAVLARWTESDEVLFGLAYRGRKTAMDNQAIYPFCLKIPPTDTVNDVVAAAARYDDQMRKYDHMGLQKFSALNPSNIVLCKFRNLMIIGDNIHDLDAEDIEEQYPLSLYVRGTVVQAFFDPLVVSAHELHTLLNQLADVVQASIENPDSTIQNARIVGEEGISQMRHWHVSRNGALTVDEDSVLVHELINSQLLNNPSALAVSAWDGSLTYAELNQWASCLSSNIASDEFGVRPGQFIGLLMSKSVTTVVAMLSVIKSGAAFVFLPPSLPIERLKTMCRIASVHRILTTSGHQAKAAQLGVPLTQVDSKPDLTKNVELVESVVLNGPLYAVFTSGSTGEPKGVQIDRESFGPGIAEYCRRTRLGPTSRVFQSVSYAFVVSILEQLIALAVGACICLPSEEQLENQLEATLAECKATWASMTPTIARTLVPSQFPALESLILAGEPITAADVNQWKNHTILYSMYGQSETASTLLVNQIDFSFHDPGNLGTSTTGKCWVVDPLDHHRLRGVGIEGELLLESHALGVRYLGNNESTAAAFVERPAWSLGLDHDDQTEPRWLLTGDLVKYSTSDGSIQLVGRKGTQTKIRGQRVELGEIESCLRSAHSSAQQVIAEVVTPADANGEAGKAAAILVAFTCSGSQTPASTFGLEVESTVESRAHNREALAALRKLLPSYMIPSAILNLRELPRTASGKINRKVLRDWAAERRTDEILGIDEDLVAFRAPVTLEERALQLVCAKVLHLPSSKVGLDDNFFHMGGDSLKARQLVSASRSHGLHITVADVFNQPNLATLAKCYVKLDIGSQDSIPDENLFAKVKGELLQMLPPELDSKNFESVFPTLDMQTHLVKNDVFDYLPVEIQGPVAAEQLRSACQTLVDIQPALRSLFIPLNDQTVQVVLRQANIPWAEHSAPPGSNLLEWAHSWVMEDRERVPPNTQLAVSFTLIHHDSGNCAFIIRLSHAQYDGVCLKPLFQQLESIYAHPGPASQRRPDADFVSYRRACERLRTPQAFEHWKDLLAGSEVTRLPRLCLGDVAPAFFIGECAPAPPPTGITMATAIKAAWACVLAQETGKSDVLFGQVTNCRGVQPEAGQEIIGMCLNTTPVRVQVDPKTRIRDLLAFTQEQHVRSLAYETTDWPDVVAQSTSWPADTILDSVVLHENFDSLREISLGGSTAQIKEPIFKPVGSPQHILVTWPGPESMMTFLVSRTGALEQTLAEGLVKRFNETLVRFLASPDDFISLVC
ncbi:unnamed protein product [Penicillium salamii]|uniref:Carrier domain-containing protein n=1 Tax=Penicillium salamii TaxID=1612424 RepID=A0A9W4NN70_9EURO|nr:unnamed protein product [Penicillium salamii]CAG8360512.1 unnamed protein product [Penicillium salamii]CAG8388160.1 unnamed protein product [Penicillium salamii]CAG8396742.1 unnamed protein product [Penicillium salamii]